MAKPETKKTPGLWGPWNLANDGTKKPSGNRASFMQEIRVKVREKVDSAWSTPNLFVKQVVRENAYGIKLSEKKIQSLCSDVYFVHEGLTLQGLDSHFI